MSVVACELAPDDDKLYKQHMQRIHDRLEKESEEEKARIKASYASSIPAGSPHSIPPSNTSPVAQSPSPSSSRHSNGAKIPRLEFDSSSPRINTSRTGGSNNSGGSGGSPHSSRSRPSRILAPLKADFVFGKHDNYVSYNKVTLLKDRERQQMVQQGTMPVHTYIPGSNNGFHYMDYTYDEISIPCFPLSSAAVFEKLLEHKGNHQIRIHWCSACESASSPRQKAWDILQSIMLAFPNFDYLHSLPSEINDHAHQNDLLRTNHKKPISTCDEMYVLFKPRGRPLLSLKATDGPTAVKALTDAMEKMPIPSIEVTLLSARNLKSPRLLGQNCNPLVQLEINGETMMSHFVPKTCNPNFMSEVFSFNVNSMEQPLIMEVIDFESKKKQKLLGRCTVPLTSMKKGEIYRLTVELVDAPGEINVVVHCVGDVFSEGSSGKKHSYRVARNHVFLPVDPESSNLSFQVDPNSNVHTNPNATPYS